MPHETYLLNRFCLYGRENVANSTVYIAANDSDRANEANRLFVYAQRRKF